MKRLPVLILFLLFAGTVSAQSNFFIGLDIATGSTFTGVSYDDYRYQHLQSRYSPTFNFGVDIRKDFKRHVSLLTGAYVSLMNYRVSFPYGPKPDPYGGFNERIRFSEWSHMVGVPIVLKYRFPLKKNEDVSLGIDAGFSMNFLTGATGGENGGGNIRNSIDSTGESSYAGYESRGGGNILLILGFGVDKIIGKRSLMNISLLANIGTTTVLDGEFLYYDHAVDFPDFPLSLKPADVPTESYRFYSRNSSVMLKVTYYFAMKGLRE